MTAGAKQCCCLSPHDHHAVVAADEFFGFHEFILFKALTLPFLAQFCQARDIPGGYAVAR
jgi:hypothetical protein